MKTNLDWHRYRAIRDKNLPYRESLAQYAAIGREHFDVDGFEQFCERQLGDLDEITWEYFGEARAKEVIRAKVETLFPKNEHEEFTEHFWNQIQQWRHDEAH